MCDSAGESVSEVLTSGGSPILTDASGQAQDVLQTNDAVGILRRP